MKIHSMVVPFFRPIKSNGKSLAANIEPVNHNRINTGLVVSIASYMLGHYEQDTDNDTFQLQNMGLDAGVLVGYNEKYKNFVQQYIHSLDILFINSLSNL
jgi:hypothetical protein